MGCPKMSHILCALALLSFYYVTPSYGYNYLVVGGDGGGSHYYAIASIGRELAQRGHNVTVLISNMFADNAANKADKQFEFVVYNSLVTEERWLELVADIVDISFQTPDIMTILRVNALAEALTRDQCESILIDAPVMTHLKEQTFDLVIGDLFYICVGLVAQYLDVPFITLSPHSTMSIQAQMNMSPTNPAFIPDMITGLDTRMTFKERVINTLTVTMNSYMNRRMLTEFDKFRVKYNIRPDLSSFATLGHAELWFINTHFVLDFPRPLMPNAIPVGGLTTRPARPLQKDLESFMQSSEEDGVIVFSLGSYVSITRQNFADMIADVFAQVPEKVVWKHKGKAPRNPSENVKLMDVIPQNDLLGHPKTKLLIYHCGNNGVYEAVYHGIPTICIPVFFDQFDNAQRVASRGAGLRLDITKLTSATLLEAIHTVLNDDKYRSNMKRMSSIFRDTPKSPPQQATDWAEFVTKHGGAHLRSAAHDLTLWQYHLIDVWAFLIGCVFAVLIVTISICRCGFRLICSTRKTKLE